MDSKRILTALLAACLLGCTSCGGGESGTEPAADTVETAAETAAETDYLDTLEIRDMAGHTFAVFGQSYASRQNFYLEEKDGDAMNDALRARDLAVEERLNLSLAYEGMQDR